MKKLPSTQTGVNGSFYLTFFHNISYVQTEERLMEAGKSVLPKILPVMGDHIFIPVKRLFPPAV